MPSSRVARGGEVPRTSFEQEQAMKQTRRTNGWSKGIAGILAALAGLIIPAAHADSVIDEWAAVKAPPPPELKPVSIDAASTALIVMDISSQSCTVEKRPRCVAML